MTPGQQQRKDAQDDVRREQQADERIRELEKMVKLLAQHAKEAEEIHGIDGKALVDEAEEVLGGKAASITPAVELEEDVKRLRHQTKRAYTMLDRYANEVSDEAYRWIELALISALEGGDEDA